MGFAPNFTPRRRAACCPAFVRSTIKPRLDGGIVTTARADVDVVVTEHGAAHLRGCSIGERARRLVTVAAPEFRDALEKEISQL